MAFLSEDEVAALTINRMIFHVVGKGLEVPVLLNEISPPQHVDFFLARIQSSLKGNMFEFLELSNTERILRIIHSDADNDQTCFSEQSKLLASDFQSRHSGNTSQGVFFLFELINNNEKLYALIKYDNEDVVRYVLDEDPNIAQVPRLERFHETFVKKAEAMQKIALVKLSLNKGGLIAVIDRSKRSNISDYFEGFLQVKRINDEKTLTEKLVDILKKVFKQHKDILPDHIKQNGINRIYETLSGAEQEFNTTEPTVNLSAIFGHLEDDSPIIRSFKRESRNQGILGESFTIKPEYIKKPKRRRIETTENVVILFDDDNTPEINNLEDGRQEIKIVTARIIRDDIDTRKN
ncbi:nucleoid-associated protein [Sodalis sp. RH20]|uniref:nucleoid-associated protein n=1 Tax=unclassified Sodalis (in: enterobacteria) TaxID=2636512 RepID=UPI0039B59A46